ncbi:two component transcriptional regulator, winged helix family [Desulfofarcimen acetoxidans DSM 771]|jgi:two-component system response regulator ResD|uniref:Stage 0 sporulation protein A homolog n=1 Tax=Desulfofarcimen acetoxidans (strain ATCC 49208 / DSM 771 / KCTC 5769 / VKM B-1644 / 5575) TaxID=485916 RepID=C8VZC1_DESAS|nr:response regulator transcription factor [Desulfofarcimen acetoxidans]ACV64866.1 two component transcriptional regulator, winged helix family [Desulfofarcimen acetoxidans DSM 771]
MKNIKILIVDNDRNVRDVIKLLLVNEGFTVDESGDGNEALDIFSIHNYSLISLDVMLPGLDGWTVCKKIRERSNIPIIILTARDEEYAKLLGFELGVDDYITKPFSPKEVVARIKAVLKRANIIPLSEESFLKTDKIRINPSTREVYLDDKELKLTPKEYTLLYHFVKYKDQVFTREELLTEVWGYDFYGDLRTVDTHIKQIREKLGEYKKYISTVWGVGYKFKVR